MTYVYPVDIKEKPIVWLHGEIKTPPFSSGDPSVSLDLIIRSLLALGTSNKDIARTIAS